MARPFKANPTATSIQLPSLRNLHANAVALLYCPAWLAAILALLQATNGVFAKSVDAALTCWAKSYITLIGFLGSLLIQLRVLQKGLWHTSLGSLGGSMPG